MNLEMASIVISHIGDLMKTAKIGAEVWKNIIVLGIVERDNRNAVLQLKAEGVSRVVDEH